MVEGAPLEDIIERKSSVLQRVLRHDRLSSASRAGSIATINITCSCSASSKVACVLAIAGWRRSRSLLLASSSFRAGYCDASCSFLNASEVLRAPLSSTALGGRFFRVTRFHRFRAGSSSANWDCDGHGLPRRLKLSVPHPSGLRRELSFAPPRS
jgi:hypothetical protein